MPEKVTVTLTYRGEMSYYSMVYGNMEVDHTLTLVVQVDAKYPAVQLNEKGELRNETAFCALAATLVGVFSAKVCLKSVSLVAAVIGKTKVWEA